MCRGNIFSCGAFFVCLMLCFFALDVRVMAQVEEEEEEEETPAEETNQPSREDIYYAQPYDPAAPSPLFLGQHRLPPLGGKRRAGYLYAPSYSRSLSIDTALNYTLKEQIQGFDYRPPMNIPFDEYVRHKRGERVRQYWKQLSLQDDGESPVSQRIDQLRFYIGDRAERLFGGTYVDIDPNILLTLDMSGRWDYTENPSLPINRRRNFLFDLKTPVTINTTGKVGEKLKITFNYDPQSPFGSFNSYLKNNVRLEFTGFEEDILQQAVLGNISLEQKNSLIRGSQNLFGVKTKLQFGDLSMTALFAQQRSQADVLSLDPGGAQKTQFNILAADYEEDQHFFLSHFFRDNYETWLEGRPIISSGVTITRTEVYVINRNNASEALRSVAAFMDLGEPRRIFRPNNVHIGMSMNPNGAASNGANNLFASLVANEAGLRSTEQAFNVLNGWGLEQSVDYEVVTAGRRLEANEYSLHASLGYISLSRPLQNDEMLAVSYEYNYNGQRYQVGELSEDYQGLEPQQAIFLKLLRPTRIAIELPTFDLMLKNIYSVGRTRLSQGQVSLQINYRDDIRGLDNPILPEGKNFQGRQLIELLGLDLYNPNGDPPPDGSLDFIEGITVQGDRGRVIFPVLEPFGETLSSYFDPADESELIDRYVYSALYTQTQNDAEQLTEFNKYTLTGEYEGGSSEYIQFPSFGVVENSVNVTAGGRTLVEGQDYAVNYQLGRVTILNQSILTSGQQIDLAYERNNFLSTRTRNLFGSRLDYAFSDELTLGGNFMYLGEQQGNFSRFQLGSEPIRNIKYGFDLQWDHESIWLTKMVDKLPLLSTNEPSKVRVSAEYAQLIPGTANVVGGEETFYLDDFESTVQPISLGHPRSWSLAATPQVAGNLFDLSSASDPLGAGYRRARTAWYSVDNSFYLGSSNVLEENLGPGGKENHYVRRVPPQEIFPLRDVNQGVVSEQVFNLAYYPSERGPYNYNPGLDEEGRLSTPRMNWGGITRGVGNEVDFDQLQVEYLEFWLMDPFISGEKGRVYDGIENQNNTTGGVLVFNLGNVSEEVIPDGSYGFENGLPANGSDQGVIRTPWGRVTTNQLFNRAFENNAQARANQDVGYDGLRNEAEASFYEDTYLSRLSAEARQRVASDPSADNFRFYLSQTYDETQASILERYKYFNNPDGNTPLVNAEVSPIGNPFPENEDLNLDNVINQREAYYAYEIPLRPGELSVGNNYISDRARGPEGANWYLFRVPIRYPTSTHGSISDYKSIKFIRMYLAGFVQPVVLRMVRMQLVGTSWNPYEGNLAAPGVVPGANTEVNFSVVGVEENSSGVSGKSPYVVPPGLSRDQQDLSFTQQRYNEQSLQLCVSDLVDGDARGVFKEVSQMLINYERLRMFFHLDGEDLQSGDLEAFLRIGSDYDQNYYEIAVPLVPTPPGVSGSNIARLVWPLENEIDLSLDALTAVKLRRDREGFNVRERYLRKEGRYSLYVTGRPRLSEVRVTLIGLRNPESNDRRTLSGCLWANELRMTGVERKNGLAGNFRIDTKLADIIDVSAGVRYQSIGFGGLQDRVQQRSLEESVIYNVSANLDLGRFLPQSTGIRIPTSGSYEADQRTPEYDPLNTDIPLDVTLQSLDPGERETYKQQASPYSRRRGFSFTEVRKERVRPDAKVRFYDVENLAISYSYDDYLNRKVNLIQRSYHYHGRLGYNFSVPPAYLEPFKKIGGNNPYMAWFKDFSMGLYPQTLTANLDIDRKFEERMVRLSILNPNEAAIPPVYTKTYTFDRNYAMTWALSRNLTLQYSAQVGAIIDEAPGRLNEEERKQVFMRILRLGRMRRYQQSLQGDYNFPLQKFPIIDWTTLRYNLQLDYNWQTGSLAQDPPINTAGNSRQHTWNAALNLGQLYAKFQGFPLDQTKLFEPKNLGLQFLTLLQRIEFTYNLTETTILPGLSYVPQWLGYSFESEAPGWSFIFGSQNRDVRLRAARGGWFSRDGTFSVPFNQSRAESMDLRTDLRLPADINIQLSASRTITVGYQELFRYDPEQDTYVSLSPARTGSFSTTFFSLPTIFSAQEGQAAFDALAANRSIVKRRLDAQSAGGSYGINAQDVLIPSFIAAYTGRSAESVKLSPFPSIPIPNWRINYLGLNKIDFIQKNFSNVALTHAYTSTYRVGSFNSSLLYDDLYLGNSLLEYRRSSFFQNGRFVPFYAVPSVAVTESFSPLIGLSVALRNGITLSSDYRISRQLTLNLSNAQVQETKNHDVSFDVSYSINRLRLPIFLFGRNRILENTLTFRSGITYAQSTQRQRVLDDESLITAGNQGFQLRASVDYNINTFANLQFYFEYGNDQPALSNAFPRSRTAGGLRLQINWSEN